MHFNIKNKNYLNLILLIQIKIIIPQITQHVIKNNIKTIILTLLTILANEKKSNKYRITMITFKSDLQSYFASLNEKIGSKNTTNQILSYLSQNIVTSIGFYGMLENNQIENILSIKKILINLFVDIKMEILDDIHYLTDEHLQDLSKIKVLFQINEHELLNYKTSEIQDIISKQIFTLESKELIKKDEIKKNLISLKLLLGIPTLNQSKSEIDRYAYLTSTTEILI